MLNKTLIKQLKELNTEAEIRMGYYDGFPLLFVAKLEWDDDVIWLECGEDITVNEASAMRFSPAITNDCLVELLKTMNPEAEIRMGRYDGPPILFVASRIDEDSVIWLECEDNIDLGEELPARFNAASEEQLDELDFYMDLVEIGITVNMVRKYMDDEHADHMQRFCEEHGMI